MMHCTGCTFATPWPILTSAFTVYKRAPQNTRQIFEYMDFATKYKYKAAYSPPPPSSTLLSCGGNYYENTYKNPATCTHLGRDVCRRGARHTGPLAPFLGQHAKNKVPIYTCHRAEELIYIIYGNVKVFSQKYCFMITARSETISPDMYIKKRLNYDPLMMCGHVIFTTNVSLTCHFADSVNFNDL